MFAVRNKTILLLAFFLFISASSMASSSRIQIETQNEYSSIVMNNGSTQNLEIKIVNMDTAPKDITVSFSKVKTEFLDGDNSKTLTIPGDTNQSFIIRLNPVKTGERNLNIDVRNNDLSLNTTKKVPVTVLRSPNQGSREVPGITIINYAVITLTSTVLYFELL